MLHVTKKFHVKQNTVLSKVYNLHMRKFSILIIFKEIICVFLLLHVHSMHKVWSLLMLLRCNVDVVTMTEKSSSDVACK